MKIHPEHLPALNNLAYHLADHANRVDEALGLAEKAKQMAPEDPAVDDTIGWVYHRKGLHSLAVQHLQRAVAKSARPGVAIISRWHITRREIPLAPIGS